MTWSLIVKSMAACSDCLGVVVGQCDCAATFICSTSSLGETPTKQYHCTVLYGHSYDPLTAKFVGAPFYCF